MWHKSHLKYQTLMPYIRMRIYDSKYGTTRVLFASTYTGKQMKTMYYSLINFTWLDYPKTNDFIKIRWYFYFNYHWLKQTHHNNIMSVSLVIHSWTWLLFLFSIINDETNHCLILALIDSSSLIPVPRSISFSSSSLMGPVFY